MIEFALTILTVIVCIICLCTDLKYGKIKNTVVLPSAIVGCAMNLFLSYKSGVCVEFILNCTAITFFSIVMYFLRIWGAGDSKFLIFVVSSMPVGFYQGKLSGYFSGFVILMYIFVIAFAYLMIESIVLYIRKTDTVKREKNFTKTKIKHIAFRFIGGISLITALNMLFYYTLGNFYVENQYVLMLINFFVVMCVEKLKFFSNLGYVLIFSVIVIAVMIFSGYTNRFVETDIIFLLILLVIMVLRWFMNRYDYKKVKIQRLIPGMVLSEYSVKELVSAGYKPNIVSDESLKSKLTVSEINQIQELDEISEKEVFIVRNIPFGTLIAIGTIVFVARSILCR